MVYRPNVEKEDRREEICAVFKKIFGEFDHDPSTVICDGCNCEREDAILLEPDCKTRKCIVDKGIKSCAYCKQFPCAIFPAEPSDEEIKQLRTVFLNAFVALSECCARNGLTVMLIGGSALGAVRHKGFIPWDDDFDVAMPRKDFERLKTLFEKEDEQSYVKHYCPLSCAEKPISCVAKPRHYVSV